MTNSNLWQTYLPRFNGDAYPGYSPNRHEVEFVPRLTGQWTPAVLPPTWFSSYTYRVRDTFPRPVEADEQPECADCGACQIDGPGSCSPTPAPVQKWTKAEVDALGADKGFLPEKYWPDDYDAPPIMLPEGDAERLDFPMFDGLMAYFPNALAEVARVSKIGNDQHNPGEPMHWARDKSTDHENKIMRHLADIGTVDPKGVLHSVRLAWRALAAAQEELERRGSLPPSRASRNRTF